MIVLERKPKPEDILFLVADNTNTNPATADLLGVPFIGCASHRFNLAVQKYLEPNQKIIVNIHQIMIRYFRLEEYIKKMDDDELNLLIPSGRELSDLKRAF